MRLQDKWDQPVRLRDAIRCFDIKHVTMTESAQFGRINHHGFNIEVIRREGESNWTPIEPLPAYISEA